jgi:hypothetical protein
MAVMTDLTSGMGKPLWNLTRTAFRSGCQIIAQRQHRRFADAGKIARLQENGAALVQGALGFSATGLRHIRDGRRSTQHRAEK